MEAALANISHISWLDAFCALRGRPPGDHTYSGRIHKGGSDDKPQSVPIVELKHLPRVGRRQIWIRMVPELTFCMHPNTTVRRTWEAADGEVELLLSGRGWRWVGSKVRAPNQAIGQGRVVLMAQYPRADITYRSGSESASKVAPLHSHYLVLRPYRSSLPPPETLQAQSDVNAAKRTNVLISQNSQGRLSDCGLTPVMHVWSHPLLGLWASLNGSPQSLSTRHTRRVAGSQRIRSRLISVRS